VFPKLGCGVESASSRGKCNRPLRQTTRQHLYLSRYLVEDKYAIACRRVFAHAHLDPPHPASIPMRAFTAPLRLTLSLSPSLKQKGRSIRMTLGLFRDNHHPCCFLSFFLLQPSSRNQQFANVASYFSHRSLKEEEEEEEEEALVRLLIRSESLAAGP
jgi:hypothetical protein